MITTSTLAVALIAMFSGIVAVLALTFGLLSTRISDLGKLLGDRISDSGTRIGSVENRMGGIETRMNALEGAVRDVGSRLTVLERDLGQH